MMIRGIYSVRVVCCFERTHICIVVRCKCICFATTVTYYITEDIMISSDGQNGTPAGLLNHRQTPKNIDSRNTFLWFHFQNKG